MTTTGESRHIFRVRFWAPKGQIDEATALFARHTRDASQHVDPDLTLEEGDEHPCEMFSGYTLDDNAGEKIAAAGHDVEYEREPWAWEEVRDPWTGRWVRVEEDDA